MLQDVLGRQQADATAALQRSLEQRHGHSSTWSPGCTAPHQGSALQPADTTQPLGCHPALLLLLLRVSGDVHVRTFGVRCTVTQVVRLVTVRVASSRRSSREDWAQRWARASWRQAHLLSLLGARQQRSGRRSIGMRLLQGECMRMRVLASERAVLCQAVCDATPLLERAHARTCLPARSAAGSATCEYIASCGAGASIACSVQRAISCGGRACWGWSWHALCEGR